MTDPISTMTASAKAPHQESATLAFQEFIEGSAGELAKKFTGEAIAKMEQLRELIRSRLTGKHPAADLAFEQALSNNQLVCALLLLVSLLTACNGTTGSGNSEVSMPSNGPPTNTTSVPTAEAENSPPATGDAVRVARWSRNPNSASMLAVKVGTLAIANNCLVMNNKDAPPALLIFPYRSGVWDDAKRSFTYDGKVIGIGEPIKVGGGKIETLDELKQRGKYEVPDCGITDFFLVG
jgi:hypothetical protein